MVDRVDTSRFPESDLQAAHSALRNRRTSHLFKTILSRAPLHGNSSSCSRHEVRLLQPEDIRCWHIAPFRCVAKFGPYWGKARIYLDRFYNELSANPKAIDEETRNHYARIYARGFDQRNDHKHDNARYQRSILVGCIGRRKAGPLEGMNADYAQARGQFAALLPLGLGFLGGTAFGAIAYVTVGLLCILLVVPSCPIVRLRESRRQTANSHEYERSAIFRGAL